MIIKNFGYISEFIKQKSTIIRYFLLVGTFLFWAKDVRADTLCKVTISPNIENHPYTTNQKITLKATECPTNISSITLAVLDSDKDGVVVAYQIPIKDRSFEYTIQHISEDKTGTYMLRLFNNESATWQIQELATITFNQIVQAECGDLVPLGFKYCPFDCKSNQVAGDIWQCGEPPPSPSPAPLSCTMNANVSRTPNWRYDEKNQFSISGFVTPINIPPGKYRFVIERGVSDYIVPWSTDTAVTDAFPFTFSDNLDSGHAGRSYVLRFETDTGAIQGTKLCEVDIKFPNKDENAIIFDPKHPENSTSNPFPSGPAPKELNLGPSFKVKLCTVMKHITTEEGGRIRTNSLPNGDGISTAFGCIPTDPGKMVGFFVGIAIGIAGGVAFLLILLGGLRILTSTGNPEAMNEGREIVSSAIVGLLLIIFSIFLLRVVGVDILGIPGFH